MIEPDFSEFYESDIIRNVMLDIMLTTKQCTFRELLFLVDSINMDMRINFINHGKNFEVIS